jgi:hypothetical protein
MSKILNAYFQIPDLYFHITFHLMWNYNKNVIIVVSCLVVYIPGSWRLY